MEKWENHRKKLDAIMMETPLDQLRQVLDEFKKINDGKSIEEILAERFEKDAKKRIVYQQLGKI